MEAVAIMFDFDGVIVDSVGIKADAFVDLFREYPSHSLAIRKYHYANGGLSRLDKIRHIHRNILCRDLTVADEERLSITFSNMVVDRVVASSYMPGAVEALQHYYARYKLFIISGTPECEIRMIVKRRGLKKYFSGVFGTPVRKSEHAKRIMKEHNLLPGDVVFVGDSLEDYRAAEACDIRFVGCVRSKSENIFALLHLKDIVQDMYGLMNIVK